MGQQVYEERLFSVVCLCWHPLHIQCPRHPWQLVGWVCRGPSQPACLPPCPRLQLFGKTGQRKANRSRSLGIQFLGFFSFSLFLSLNSGPLIISELYSLLLPWLSFPPSHICRVSIKPSDEQFSVTSLWRLCPRTRAVIADTQAARCRAAGSPFNSLPIQNGC